MRNAEVFWDKLSKNYDKNITVEHIKEYQSYQYLQNYLNSEQSLLDFGCATGTITFSLSDKVKHIHGIDLSSKMIEIAQKRKSELDVNNVEFSQSTLFDDLLKKESYSIIIAFNILHLVEDISAVTERVHHLLEKDGFFVSLTPCIGEKKALKYMLKFIKKIGLLPSINTYKTDVLRKIMENSHFEILQDTDLDNNPLEHFIIAQKK